MAPTVYALLVGMDAYPSPVPPLNGCVNDIEAVAALLQDYSVGGECAAKIRQLKNAEAVRSAIVESFRGHLATAAADDAVLFCCCGHGSSEAAPTELWHLEPDHLTGR